MRLLFTLVFMMLSMLIANASAADDSEGALGELALSNDTLQLRYINNATQLAGETTQLQGTVFLSEDRDLVLSAGVLLPVDFRLGNLSVSFGPQIYAALLNEENNDIMAISAGAKVRYLVLPGINLAVAGEAFYAPDILTFGSADNLTDLSARVEIGLSSRVIAFGGMRWFDIDLTEGGGTRTLQEEAFVGFGYRF